MKCHLFPVFIISSLFCISACDRRVVVIEQPSATPLPEPIAKTKTLETERLRGAIDDYQREPSTVNNAEVKKALAQLDGEIAELQEYIAKHDGDARAKAVAKLENMQSYRSAEMLRFTAAQAKGAVGVREPDTRTGAEKVEDSAKKVGSGIEDAAKKTGEAIKDIGR